MEAAQIDYADLKEWFMSEFQDSKSGFKVDAAFEDLIQIDNVEDLKNNVIRLFGEKQCIKNLGEFIEKIRNANKTKEGKNGKKEK